MAKASQEDLPQLQRLILLVSDGEEALHISCHQGERRASSAIAKGLVAGFGSHRIGVREELDPRIGRSISEG